MVSPNDLFKKLQQHQRQYSFVFICTNFVLLQKVNVFTLSPFQNSRNRQLASTVFKSVVGKTQSHLKWYRMHNETVSRLLSSTKTPPCRSLMFVATLCLNVWTGYCMLISLKVDRDWGSTHIKTSCPSQSQAATAGCAGMSKVHPH